MEILGSRTITGKLNVQVFKPNVKEWLFKPTTGDVPDFINGLSFKIGDDVYNMSNFKSGNNTAPDLIDSTIYKLNLKTMVWEQFYQLDYPSKNTGFALYTKQFSLIIGDFQTIIVKPSEFKYLLIDNNVFGYTPKAQINSISSDNLFFNSISSSTETYQLYKIDLNDCALTMKMIEWIASKGGKGEHVSGVVEFADGVVGWAMLVS